MSGMVIFLFLVPAGAIAGRITGTFRLGHRTLLRVDLQGRTVYVPLMRDQFLAALTSLSALKPVQGRGRFVVFRVSAADRTVWPSGPYRIRLLPAGAIVGRVLWVCGPPLLTLAVHLFRAPIAPC